MAEHSSIPSPTEKCRKPASFPKLFTGFTFNSSSETTETIVSPTSILDCKPFSGLKIPLWADPIPIPKSPEPETRRHWDKLDSRGVGLGIVDALVDDKTYPNLSKQESRTVLFGSQLKIQIRPFPQLYISPTECPKSPADFGIKTKNSQLSSFSSGLSPSPVRKSAFGANSGMENPDSPRIVTGCLSAIEMELSEDYTCVISHGPNPRTTHIFDNCIVDVESCHGGVGFFAPRRNNNAGDGSSHPSASFLSFCHTCKKNLGQGKDIFIYRGERAFCSAECRYQEMLLEEEIDKLELDDVSWTCS